MRSEWGEYERTQRHPCAPIMPLEPVSCSHVQACFLPVACVLVEAAELQAVAWSCKGLADRLEEVARGDRLGFRVRGRLLRA